MRHYSLGILLLIGGFLLGMQAVRAQNALSDSLAMAIAAANLGNDHRAALAQYVSVHVDGTTPSKSIGTVSKGSLVHGKLIPFEGDNFRYYDTLSYLDDRAFVHHQVKATVLASYLEMAGQFQGRTFTIMECSKQAGGKIWPHRTHQNGMSIDFMVPMSADGAPFYGLDSMGFSHYLLEFDAEGGVAEHPQARIDFDVMAAHLIALQQAAKANGLKVTKVLVCKELLDNLFGSAHGPQLKSLKLYFPTELEPLINGLHDNHYHVDFAFQ